MHGSGIDWMGVNEVAAKGSKAKKSKEHGVKILQIETNNKNLNINIK